MNNFANDLNSPGGCGEIRKADYDSLTIILKVEVALALMSNLKSPYKSYIKSPLHI
jgi:hypothetical protein